MSVIIRLQGLPWSASAMDIRNFFQGLSIPPGGVRIIGGDNGDAFIAFSTDEDARQAMMLTNKQLNDCVVQLFLSSKTEMQNTITQAKVNTPAVAAPVPTPPVTSNLGMTLNQIPSVQQISQAFPAVGQIIGQLGLQPPTNMNKFQGGLQNKSQPNITTPTGFLNNSNLNSLQTVKDKTIKFEQELPGEYSVGGMQAANKAFGERSYAQRQYGHGDPVTTAFNNVPLDSLNHGFPQAQQSYENTSHKDQFRGEVFFPPLNSQTQPWESNNRQQNMNQNNLNMPFGNKQALSNQSSNLSGHAGHGKPIHGDQGNLNSQQFGHGKPFPSDPYNVNNQRSFRQTDMSNQQGNQPSEFSIPPRGPLNRNFPETSRQGDLNPTPVIHLGDQSIQPKTRQSRFGPAFQSNENNFPPRGRPGDSSFMEASKPNEQYSTNSEAKATMARPIDTRANSQPVKSSTEAKSVGPAGSLILSNKRDEFGRNVPYSARDGNISDSSRTPTQDEKYDESRSVDSRSKDSVRRSSRDRDRSNRRDSPRDRDRKDRDRDRVRRDRDDDRRLRRERDKDRDRDRKPRERESDRYERSRELKDIDRKHSPVSDSNRKSRKRSLSPSSKNKNENEKKQQTEKTEKSTAVKSDKQNLLETQPETLVRTPVSVSQNSLLTEKPAVPFDNMKKSSIRAQPLFPVIPAPKAGKGLLGEAPANMAPITSTSFSNPNVPPPLLNDLGGPNNTSFRKEKPGPVARGVPLLKNPRGPGQTSSQGRTPFPSNIGIPKPAGMENMSSDRNLGQGIIGQPETFEYGHSGGVMVQSNRDMAFNNRPDIRGPREEPLNVNLASGNFRGPGRGMPPPAFMDDQHRPGFPRGPRGRLDGQQRSFNDQLTDDRNIDEPFDERHPRDFRGPPQGRDGPPGRDIRLGPNQARYGERNMEFQGQEGRRSLLGDGGAPHDFRGPPGQDGFRDRQNFDERGAPNFQGADRDERFPRDLSGFRGLHDDRRTKDTRGMPSLLDDIPIGGWRDSQCRSGRDVSRGRDDNLSDFRDGSPYESRHEQDFCGTDDHNMFGSSFRDDCGFDGRSGSNEFSGPRDFRGRGRGDRDQRDFRGPPTGGRDYQGQDFDRRPGHMRDTNIGPPNHRDIFREDDRSIIERNRERRSFVRDGPSVDRDRDGFGRREIYDNRDNRSSARYQDNNYSRDRSNERTREDRNLRDDRNRDQYNDRNERRQSSRDERKDSENDNRRNYRADERSSDRKSSAGTSKTDTNDKRSDQKKADNEAENSPDSKAESSSDVPKGTALCSIVLENIPVETTYKDIRKLFAGLELPKDGIKIINDKEGKRIGKAYVRFGSQESFKKGLQKDRTRLGHRIMVIKPVARTEFDSAIDSYIPPSGDDDDDDGPPDLDMCNSLSATLRALKGEPELKMQKKGSLSNTKDFVVKLTLLPEYTKSQNVKTFFQDLNIAQSGNAIYIEPGQLNKPCSGLCYVMFANENSYKKALNQRKVFERKTINITQGSKKDAEDLINKMKKDDKSKSSDINQESNSSGINDKQESENTVNEKEKQSNLSSTSNSQNKTSETKKDSDAVSAEFSKTQPVKSSTACTCLRIQNIPKGMKVFELRGMFENVRVAQICHDAVGKPIGEGYVELPSSSDVQKCLVKSNTYIGKNKISIEPVTKTEMIENMRLLRQSLQPETPTVKAVYFFVKAANLPRTVSTGEIMNFFSGFNPAPESIRLNIGDGSEPQDCSTALVGFRTREEAETAIAATNGNLLRNKDVALSKVIL